MDKTKVEIYEKEMEEFRKKIQTEQKLNQLLKSIIRL
jgi:hypothetical protein